MDKIDEVAIKSLYTTKEYITKNPTLHEEDTPWKVSKIVPIVDEILNSYYIKKDEINLLDVGGGTGLILRDVSKYIEDSYGFRVRKYALDLSPDMLEVQKRHNPDVRALNEDIRETSLANKEIDLTLLIDVLEHVPHPVKALEELRRISKMVIFKVPLEDCILSNIMNIINRGKTRKIAFETYGHINIYNFNGLKHQIETNYGRILNSYFTNLFDYGLTSDHGAHQMRMRAKAVNYVASCSFKVSPRLSSCFFGDFAMILAECK
jgi:SAM-dependent methyltransferase